MKSCRCKNELESLFRNMPDTSVRNLRMVKIDEVNARRRYERFLVSQQSPGFPTEILLRASSPLTDGFFMGKVIGEIGQRDKLTSVLVTSYKVSDYRGRYIPSTCYCSMTAVNLLPLCGKRNRGVPRHQPS